MERFRLELVKAWRELRDTYRPELHYMRGPGPRALAKAKAKPESQSSDAAEQAPSSDGRNAAEG
jgi:hypothetical protein